MALQAGCRPETEQTDARTEVAVLSKQLANIFISRVFINCVILLPFAVINVNDGLLVDDIQESFLIASHRHVFAEITRKTTETFLATKQLINIQMCHFLLSTSTLCKQKANFRP